MTLPTDADSRLALVRRDPHPAVDPEPTWTPSLQRSLESIVDEHRLVQRLSSFGVSPTRSVLLVGPPGTGKSLAAKWLARELMIPLLTLDLSAVMSSFLGRTGNNIRVVLDYARIRPSVLLLDEFDALAKRRDDASEIGELKRLVTVLLQEIDEWPDGLLIAATNHPDLLDRAIWRRFDQVLEFPLPNPHELRSVIASHISEGSVSDSTLSLFASELRGQSFADAVRSLAAAQRAAVVRDIPLQDVLMESVAGEIRGESRRSRLAFALDLVSQGSSQREASRVSGVSRDTLRKRLTGDGGSHGT